MDHVAARRGSRGIYPLAPFPLGLRPGCWGRASAHVWLLATSTALVRGLEVGQAWQHLHGGGGGVSLPSRVAVPGGGCGLRADWSRAVPAHPEFGSRLCVYLVCQCVFICRACVCVCIYLAASVRRLCFPFCSISANVGETSVFNQGPGNHIVATFVMAILI